MAGLIKQNYSPQSTQRLRQGPPTTYPRLVVKNGCCDARALTYVSCDHKVTYMEKTQVYLPREELEALRAAAARSGRSVAELIREAIHKTVLKPRSAGPVALWDGEPKRTSIEHDSVHDEP